MKPVKKCILAVCLGAASLPAFAEDDAQGCKDNPLFSRMPKTHISECSSNFDEMEVLVGEDKRETKEGTKTSINYDYSGDDATAPSFFQIVRNFENAVAKTGGRRVYYGKDAGVGTFLTKAGGKDVWVVVVDGGGVKGGNFQLITLTMEGMKQDIKANEMLEAINKTGSVALQINFETGKSAIKPESTPIVDQIAAMLGTERSLKVSIEGHTDNAGTPDANRVLSLNRANAVVAAMVAKGIDKGRLSARGWGQEKPVADNANEEGRARNRRVEIVKVK